MAFAMSAIAHDSRNAVGNVRKSIMKTKTRMIVSAVASMAALCLHAATLTVNGVDYTQGSGDGWSFSDSTVTLFGSGPFVLSTSGETFSDGIGVVAEADCSVTFSNLVMDVSASSGLSPFTVSPGTTNALTLVGANSLTAGTCAAGVTVASNDTGVASIAISAVDTNQTLIATGGQADFNGGAGIGGGSSVSAGIVTISGGTVAATGNYGAAGIGGGRGGNGGTVTISGGSVTATGAAYGAGIGGGYSGSGGAVAISNGVINATGGAAGSGIGGGGNGSGGTVAISGGTVTATGGSGASGIGGGFCGSGGTATISGGSVTATGGIMPSGSGSGAGIGGGYVSSAGAIATSGGTVTISPAADAIAVSAGASADEISYSESFTSATNITDAISSYAYVKTSTSSAEYRESRSRDEGRSFTFLHRACRML